MDYISTRNKSKIFSFKEIFLKGLAPDGGLFIPKKIPLYSLKDLEKLRNLSYKELASKIIFQRLNVCLLKRKVGWRKQRIDGSAPFFSLFIDDI